MLSSNGRNDIRLIAKRVLSALGRRVSKRTLCENRASVASLYRSLRENRAKDRIEHHAHQAHRFKLRRLGYCFLEELPVKGRRRCRFF